MAAGVAGLAVGAILGSALSHHRYHAGGSCAARFRSYNAATGTYLGNDGLRHPCP
ncbi:BA14K family protein [Labrys okinawensis]|uniref:BA14K family protein n=1 Tax=Labrys okinawensis TaxID=346911 RepID=UPI0039BD1C05